MRRPSFREFLPMAIAGVLAIPLLLAAAAPAGAVTAEVVALDHTIYYNRLGDVNPHGMIYALRRDVVHFNRQGANVDCSGVAAHDGKPIGGPGDARPGCVRLRDDKRPRPLILRVNEGDSLHIEFENLLAPQALVVPNPNVGVVMDGILPFGPQFDDQPHTRVAGIHVQGMQVTTSLADDGSNAGANASSLVAPGGFTTYSLYAQREGAYVLENTGAETGGEGGNGTDSQGLFGMVNVELPGAKWYRSQVTRVELELASRKADGTRNATADGHPIINYEAVYPTDTLDPRVAGMVLDGFDLGVIAREIAHKGGLPILNLVQGGAIVHSDLNAIIATPTAGGTFGRTEPANPAYPNRNHSFREFSMIFHDEFVSVQPFPIFKDPAWKFTLGSVKDGFAINYGSGGIGSEILANRLGLGPMGDCQECKYEEFFLTAWVVGDPAMVVDLTANLSNPLLGDVATKALYPEDAANVWPSYMNDRVKIRNMHIGTEPHIFHLHGHQWLFTPDDSGSNYLDAQGIGPGSTYTYEIAYGAGNRNKYTGDAIFHCHFYPHFAQGMWGLWRVHDVFEMGTRLALDADGFPIVEPGARALPDGEILAGVPIYALVPIPGRAMAPMPELDVAVQPLTGLPGSQAVIAATGVPLATATAADVAAAKKPGTAGNPGFPFFIAAYAGHRPPTPPLDLLDDGGLPRHVITSPNLPGINLAQTQTQHSFFKELEDSTAEFLPEAGTGVELAAMAFHGPQPGSQYHHPSFDTAGALAQFEVNGLPPQPGAPYADPCRRDNWDSPWDIPDPGQAITRRYKGANIQLDLIMNKVGWHFPQSRIITLWEDVAATLDGTRAPEPFVMRANSMDCVEYQHTNLVPNIYLGDDFQVETPTDIIGQHIHLVKFDITSADGAANGWNYEDGTLSPGEVNERIAALNHSGTTYPDDDPKGRNGALAAELHPFFGGVGAVQTDFWTGQKLASGARTTVQRWFIDPLLDNDGRDRGLGNVFTHDHFGPSTHQQAGLYATLLVEPTGSVWRDSVTGAPFNGAGGNQVDITRTSWQAVIQGPQGDSWDTYREFYLEYADFAIAYEAAGTPTIVRSHAEGGVVSTDHIPGDADPVNPSHRNEPGLPRLLEDGVNNGLCGVELLGRPCPEAISAADPGTYLVNYRAEPVGLRVRDPATASQNDDGGLQALGTPGDLSFAFKSIDRADLRLNSQRAGEAHPSQALGSLPGVFPPLLTPDVKGNDPFTPILRAYADDNVRVRIQVGATEESHWANIYGVNWLMEYGSPSSGHRSSQHAGISEQFQFRSPITPGINVAGNAIDTLYSTGSDTGALWNGNWGLLRSYQIRRADLFPIPGTNPGRDRFENLRDFRGVCPRTATVRRYDVTAVLARDVLPEVDTGGDGVIPTLVYNSRSSAFSAGPLHDPTAILYVMTSDLNPATGRLWDDAPVEPLVLRAAAGECVDLTLRNRLPATPTVIDPATGQLVAGPNPMPDLAGFKTLPAVIDNFNNNDVQPSNHVGLAPELVAVDISRSVGANLGRNATQTVAPGGTGRYLWYMGKITLANGARAGFKRIVATPVEFGVANLLSSDRIKHTNKGAIGALVVEPAGSSWPAAGLETDWVPDLYDPLGFKERRTRTMADVTVGASTFRDFVLLFQTDVNMRCTGCGDPVGEAPDLNAVPTVAAEEEPGDSGQKGYNYRTEPMWHRFGYSPLLTPGQQRLRDNYWQAFSNDLVGGDPETPVFTAAAGQQVRFRLAHPGGGDRANNWTLHGHIWQRRPYNADSSAIDPTGGNLSFWHGEQGILGPTSHFDVVPVNGAGGINAVRGDYLFRDTVPVHVDNGEWGLLRVR